MLVSTTLSELDTNAIAVFHIWKHAYPCAQYVTSLVEVQGGAWGAESSRGRAKRYLMSVSGLTQPKSLSPPPKHRHYPKESPRNGVDNIVTFP